MEEQTQPVQPQVKKQINKKMILSIAVIIIVLVVIALGYNQITDVLTSLISSKPVMLDQSTCTQRMTDWCNQCLSANAGRKDFWNVPGTQAGSDLVTCSNNYFGNDMKPEQDCTGNAIVYCSTLIGLQVE